MADNKNQSKKIKEKIAEEYKKCLLDPVYFIKKYVKISEQNRGIIPFELFEFQEKTLKEIHEHDRNIILKSRQLGISTLVAAYVLWVILFHEGKNVLLVSIQQDASKELVSKIKIAFENLPSWLKQETPTYNELSIKLANNSKVLATTSASDSTRGYACSILVMDECQKFSSIITVRNKITGEVENVEIGELYNNLKI